MLIFDSRYKYEPAKGMLISAANCSGKSFLFRQLTKDVNFIGIHIFEMDSLHYFREKSLSKKLPAAWENFIKMDEKNDKHNLRDELFANIRSSCKKSQLIKLTLVDLMSTPGKFITVLPRALRHDANDIRFLQLLEEYFEKRIVHIAIIPNLIRHFVNIIKRKSLLRFSYVVAALGERRLLISEASLFDCVIRIPLWNSKQNDTSEILNKYI